MPAVGILVPVAVAALFGRPAGAQQVNITPRIVGAVTLSDNLDFQEDGRSGARFSVVPGVILSRDGPRSEFVLDLKFVTQYDTLDREVETRIEAQGIANGTAELAADRLFVDAMASVSQELLDTRIGGERRDEFRDDDLATVQAYSLSPYHLQRFGNFATGETRGRVSYVTASEGLETAVIYEAGQTIAAGPSFTRNIWDTLVKASHTRELTDSQTEGFEGDPARERVNEVAALGNLEHVINENWSLIGTLGYERLESNRIDDDLAGITWRTGAIFRLPPRLSLTAAVGQRLEHPNYFVDLDYAVTDRTTINAGYERTIEKRQRRFLRPLPDIPDFVFDPTAPNVVFTRDPTVRLTSTLAIRDDYSFSVTTFRGRNNFRADIGYTRVEELETQDTEYGNHASFIWSRQLTPRSVGFLELTYENSRRPGGSDDFYEFQLGGSHRLGRTLSANLVYSHRLLDQKRGAGDIRENAITFSIVKTF